MTDAPFHFRVLPSGFPSVKLSSRLMPFQIPPGRRISHVHALPVHMGASSAVFLVLRETL